MHGRSLGNESAGQLDGRSLQQGPTEGVEASEPEPVVPDVDVGKTKRPHGGGEKLRGDGSAELAGYSDDGCSDAAGPAANPLQSPYGVARRLPQS